MPESEQSKAGPMQQKSQPRVLPPNVTQPKPEEYEMVPITPIRRLERRMDGLERAGVSTESIRKLVEAVRSNQGMVEEVIKLNTEMVRRVSDLTTSVGELTTHVNDLVSRLRLSEASGRAASKSQPETDARLDKLEKRVNSLIITMMARRRAPANAQQAPTQMA